MRACKRKKEDVLYLTQIGFRMLDLFAGFLDVNRRGWTAGRRRVCQMGRNANTPKLANPGFKGVRGVGLMCQAVH